MSFEGYAWEMARYNGLICQQGINNNCSLEEKHLGGKSNVS